MVCQQRFTIQTAGHGDMHNITGEVAEIVASSGVRAGTVQVFNVGSTAAIGAIEFEPGLQRDLPEILDRLKQGNGRKGRLDARLPLEEFRTGVELIEGGLERVRKVLILPNA